MSDFYGTITEFYGTITTFYVIMPEFYGTTQNFMLLCQNFMVLYQSFPAMSKSTKVMLEARIEGEFSRIRSRSTKIPTTTYCSGWSTNYRDVSGSRKKHLMARKYEINLKSYPWINLNLTHGLRH
jgi:hypothetical protein